jgi:hypothetical protein
MSDSLEHSRTLLRIEQLYHKGQTNIWDGKSYLQECVDRHGTPQVPEASVEALQNIFGVILWGELAAWKISSALALSLDSDEARMAATSQAHDEARHYYVMKDYLQMLGHVPESIDKHADEFLGSILRADSTSKMLLGMQLMVEPMALTLFKIIREEGVDPVLSDLLVMYERDEARHVALGTMYLPKVLAEMSAVQKGELLLWQFMGYMKQFEMLKALSDDFTTLGISPRSVFALARKKQVKAMELLSDELGERYPFMDTMLRVIDFRNEISFPESESGYIDRVRNAIKVAVGG